MNICLWFKKQAFYFELIVPFNRRWLSRTRRCKQELISRCWILSIHYEPFLPLRVLIEQLRNGKRRFKIIIQASSHGFCLQVNTSAIRSFPNQRNKRELLCILGIEIKKDIAGNFP